MFEDIVTFRAIVQLKCLTKAGKELGISTPVVTRRLARLEKSLNARLIQRTTRQLYLTEAGELFFAKISDILHALDASKEAVKNLSKEVTGSLKIGLPASISYLYVTKMLHKFMACYPNINIHIVTGNHLLGLLTNGFDLVIHAGVLPDSSFYYKKIGSWQKKFCASPVYLAKYGIPKKPQELSLHNCIDHYDNFVRVWEYKENGIIKNIIVNGNIRADSNFDIKQLAISGIGIAYLPKCTVNEDLKQGGLVAILEDFQASEFATYAVYPSKQFIRKNTHVFLEFMSDLLESVYGQMNVPII
jgi:LysR family transcriptional regulator, regulator for bpeEF and oprC